MNKTTYFDDNNGGHIITEKDVPRLIEKLISFLGRKELEKRLMNYTRSMSSSSDFMKYYYLKNKYYWLEAFKTYFELQKEGKSIKKHLTDNLISLAGDALKVIKLNEIISSSIRNEYKRNLITCERSSGYLFEIQIAWHFYLKSGNILWHENTKGRRSEFLVKDGEVEFNVECKRVGIDISRKIRRKDFYRLAEKLIAQVQSLKYSGDIEVELSDRLHSNEEYLDELVEQICNLIKAKKIKGNYSIPLGQLKVDLMNARHQAVDLNKEYQRVLATKKPSSHVAIFASEEKKHPVDAVKFALSSEKTDDLLEGIKKKLKGAAIQLDCSKAGLIVCFLEGVLDMRDLSSGSGLQYMTYSLLNREEFSHVAAISYCSEAHIDRLGFVGRHYNQALTFKNIDCKFKGFKDYKFTV